MISSLIKFRAISPLVLRFDYYAIIAKKPPARRGVFSYIFRFLHALTVRLHSQAYLTLSRLRPLSAFVRERETLRGKHATANFREFRLLTRSFRRR